MNFINQLLLIMSLFGVVVSQNNDCPEQLKTLLKSSHVSCIGEPFQNNVTISSNMTTPEADKITSTNETSGRHTDDEDVENEANISQEEGEDDDDDTEWRHLIRGIGREAKQLRSSVKICIVDKIKDDPNVKNLASRCFRRKTKSSISRCVIRRVRKSCGRDFERVASTQSTNSTKH